MYIERERERAREMCPGRAGTEGRRRGMGRTRPPRACGEPRARNNNNNDDNNNDNHDNNDTNNNNKDNTNTNNDNNNNHNDSNTNNMFIVIVNHEGV